MRVTGCPIATVVRGNLVMKDDEVLASPIGEPVRFWSTLRGK
jgi:dihydroorotase